MKRVGASLAVAVALSCNSTAAPRAQVVLYVDTNTPLVGQLSTRPDLSSDAAIDSLHIEVLDDNSKTIGTLDQLVPDIADWPVSFGIAADRGAGQILHARIRAYNAAFVRATDVQTLAASASVIVDRLVDITASSEVVSSLVVLSGDCFGASATLAVAPEPAVTCIDHASPTALPSAGTTNPVTPPTQSVAGSWAPAIAQPCAGTAPSGARCIQGGVTFLGDLTLAGVQVPLGVGDTVPLRPAHLDPFFLDVTEFTVERYRALVQAGKVTGTPTSPSAPASECTWLGPSDDTNDKLPLTCVERDTAAAACRAMGGVLPSEAQWEHAARGRGQGFRYPWGNTDPQCCSANYGGTATVLCPGGSISPVGSHASPSGGCTGPFDVSPDGIEDLAGNADEWASDNYESYGGPCWDTPIRTDPTCDDPDSSENVTRGGNALSLEQSLLSAMRTFHVPGTAGPTRGFRCAYGATSP